MTFVSSPGTGSTSPVLDYSSRDYVAVLTDLVNRIQVYLPEWTSRSASDPGIVLLQLYAYTVDNLAYYIDRISGEAFLQTATQPQSIINLAEMLGYTPALSNGATVTLVITISPGMASGFYPVTIPAGSVFSTVPTASTPAITFVTTQALVIEGSAVASPQFTGTVLAEQGVQFNENVAVSDGTINQLYPLLNSPVSANSLTVEVNLGAGLQEWAFVESLIDSGPNDLVYTNYVDANQNFFLQFGDGVNGFVPTLGSPITATYLTNSGSLGNVGANTITLFSGPPIGSAPVVGLASVTNPQAASGGAFAESVSSIQQNAPASLRALNRGVNIIDIAALAQGLSGVQWASAIQATYQLVNLFISPAGGGNVSALLAEQITTAMEAVVMGNTTVTVLSPNYIPIDITVQATIGANFSDSVVQQSIVDALNNLFTLTATGFGFRVALGLVYQTVLAVAGVEYAFVTELTREIFATLLSSLVSGTQYSALTTSALPQEVFVGDMLNLVDGASNQTVTVSANAAAGSNTIPVFTFTANANYAAGAAATTIEDTTVLADAVLLANEIPVAGVMTVTTTGGIPT